MTEMQNRGSAMASLLYPERKKPVDKNFLRNHVNDIRSTQKENRQRKTEEKERTLNANRLRESLLKRTISRYDKPRSSSRPPTLSENQQTSKSMNFHPDFGKVPDYIKRFEADKVEEEKRRLEIAEASKIPQGCRYMSQQERLSSLEDVHKSRTLLMEELKSMPLNLTTLRQRRRKIEIDLKLCEFDRLASHMVENITSVYDLVSNTSWLNQEYLESQLRVSKDTTNVPTTFPEWDGSVSFDLCIFHAPCNDGTAAAYAVSLKFPKCEFLGVNRGSGVDDTFLSTEILESKIQGKNIVLVDYVYPKYSMLELIDCANHIVVIDHHVSEYRFLKEEICFPENQLIYSTDFSACILTWKYFHPKLLIPPLILYINDSDVAQYALENTGAIISGMAVHSPVVGPGLWSVKDEPFRDFHRAVSRGDEFLRSMMLIGVIAREIEWRDVYTDAQRCVEGRLEVSPNHLCRILNVSPGPRMGALSKALLCGNFSDTPKPPCDIAVLYYRIDVNGSFKVCLRSNEDVNVGEIARMLGGGGHAQAASFTHYSSTIDELFLSEVTESQIDEILERVDQYDNQWSSTSMVSIINGLRNGWKNCLSKSELGLLKRQWIRGLTSTEIEHILQSRGLIDIPDDDPWCGIGLLTSGRLVYYKINNYETVVSEEFNHQYTALKDPRDIWPVYEGMYMEYYFWDTWRQTYVFADSLREVEDDGPKKLVRLAIIS